MDQPPPDYPTERRRSSSVKEKRKTSIITPQEETNNERVVDDNDHADSRKPSTSSSRRQSSANNSQVGPSQRSVNELESKRQSQQSEHHELQSNNEVTDSRRSSRRSSSKPFSSGTFGLRVNSRERSPSRTSDIKQGVPSQNTVTSERRSSQMRSSNIHVEGPKRRSSPRRSILSEILRRASSSKTKNLAPSADSSRASNIYKSSLMTDDFEKINAQGSRINNAEHGSNESFGDPSNNYITKSYHEEEHVKDLSDENEDEENLKGEDSRSHSSSSIEKKKLSTTAVERSQLGTSEKRSTIEESALRNLSNTEKSKSSIISEKKLSIVEESPVSVDKSKSSISEKKQSSSTENYDNKEENDLKRRSESPTKCSPVALGQCARRELQLKEAEKEIENKDIIIKMLQDQVKKMEESYKNNLKQTEEFRYKYCQASEQINKLRNICSKHEQQKQFGCKFHNFPENEINAIRKEFAKWKQQYEQLANHQTAKANVCEKSSFNATEGFLKFHCDVMNSLIQKIIDQKCNKFLEKKPSSTASKCTCGNQLLGLPTIDEETRNQKLAEILSLKEQITRLKAENLKLQEQELTEAESVEPVCENVYRKDNFEKTPSGIECFIPIELGQDVNCSPPRTGSNYSQETENYNFTFTEKEGVQSVSAERIYITSSQNVTPRANNTGNNNELIEKLKEIADKINGLERKEDDHMLELKLLKQQLTEFNGTTSDCLNQLCKLKNYVKTQNEDSSTKITENCEIVDCLAKEILDLKENIREVKEQLQNLVTNVHDWRSHTNRSVNISPEVQEKHISDPIDVPDVHEDLSNITVEECVFELENIENNTKNPHSATNVLMNHSYSVVMHQTNPINNIEILREHFIDLQREKDEKEKQISWLQSLMENYGSKTDQEISLSEAVQVERAATRDCSCETKDDDKFKFHLENILLENSKLKSAINTIMECLKNKICPEENLSSEVQNQSAAKIPVEEPTDNKTASSNTIKASDEKEISQDNFEEPCVCGENLEKSKQNLTKVEPPLIISSKTEVITDAAPKSVESKNSREKSQNLIDLTGNKSEKSNDKITNEVLVEEPSASPEKPEVPIEDIYKSVKCSCMSLSGKFEISSSRGASTSCQDSSNFKKIESNKSQCTYCKDCSELLVNSLKQGRSASTSKAKSERFDPSLCTMCGTIGGNKSSCVTDSEKLDMICNSIMDNNVPKKTSCDDNKGLLCNLESYFDYLQQQLEVICNIESEIEHMRSEVRSQHIFSGCKGCR